MVAIEAGRRLAGEGGEALANAPRNIAQALLLAVITSALAATSAYLIAGTAVGIAVAALVAVYLAVLTWLPASMVMSIYRARAVPAGQAGHISALTHEIGVVRAHFGAAPQLYVLPSLTLTAFSLGTPARSAIAVSEGLLRQLTTREIAGVIAHEVAHIRAGDTLVFALADACTRIAQALALTGTIFLLANVAGALLLDDEFVPWLAAVVLVFTPAAVSLAQTLLSHGREYHADAAAVRLTGDALGLAGAIRRMGPDANRPDTSSAVQDLIPPAFARHVPLPSLLRQHPDGSARIDRVLASDSGASTPLVTTEQPMVLHVGFGPAEMRARYRWPGIWC